MGGEAEASGGPRPALLAIRQGVDDSTFNIICEGECPHRIERSEDGLRVMVELLGVANLLGTGDLPRPVGLLEGVAIGSGPEGDGSTRVLFALHRRAEAVASPTQGGVEIRFQIPADVGAAAAALPTETSSAGLSGPGERPVGTEDLLEISVFEIPELNRTVRVSERGTISLPLLGAVEVAGLTQRQLEDRLRLGLKERYLQNPQVSVFVREHGSKKVSVLGAVGEPGVYEMLGPRTLLQILAQAGGLTEEVGGELYLIRRQPGGASEKIVVNVDDLLVSRDPSLNLPVLPGDIISAPMDRQAFIYVDGAVKTPGRIEQPASRPITLLQAVAKAGGATERANLKAIQILRQSPDGTQTILEVNLKRIRRGKEPDPLLGDGDVVVIPETFF